MMAPHTAQPWSQLNIGKESKAADLTATEPREMGRKMDGRGRSKDQNIGASGQDKLCLGCRDGASWVLETHLTLQRHNPK